MIFGSMEHERLQPDVKTYSSLHARRTRIQSNSRSFYFNGASTCAAECDPVQLLDQCMQKRQKSRESFGDVCFHRASACAAEYDNVQLLDKCVRERQEPKASVGSFCFHGAATRAAKYNHAQLLDQCCSGFGGMGLIPFWILLISRKTIKIKKKRVFLNHRFCQNLDTTWSPTWSQVGVQVASWRQQSTVNIGSESTCE